MPNSPKDSPHPLRQTIEDFGQKIDGARKDSRVEFFEALQGDLPANPLEIKLSKHLPRPDARVLLELGFEMRRVATAFALLDSVPGKPAVESSLADWGRTVRVVRGLVVRLIDRGSLLPMEDFDRAISALPGLRELVERYRALGYPAFLKAGRRQSGGRKFRIFRCTQKGEFFIGANSNCGVVRLQSGFPSASAAFEWISSHAPELAARWKILRREQRTEPSDQRVGPPRREGDVTPAAFAETFGFRGVQFGNSVDGSRRQRDLNNAFDAFLDLAEALGIPPKAVSLDGSLALSFGARGSGGRNAAAAHYETDQVIINLTRKNGPGSLAHEWFHALDNYFARLERTGSTTPQPIEDYTADLAAPPENIRPEMMEAFRGIHRALEEGNYATRCASLDAERETPYHGLPIEKAARGFEIFLIARLAATGIENGYLAKPRKELLDAYPLPEEMEGGIRQAYDLLFNTLQTRESEQGVILFAKQLRKTPSRGF
jgi:hypothetical protein